MILLLLVVAVGYLIYRWSVATFDYFEKLNVPFLKPYPFFGALWPSLKGEKSPTDATAEGYRLFPGNRFSGFFSFREPGYLIHDPELIKQIAIRDFDHFTDHANNVPLEVDPFLGRGLFFTGGQRWKHGRTALSPAFTGSKMRNMFQLLSSYTDGAMKRLVKDAAGGKLEREMKDLFQRLGNDVMTSISLGFDTDSVHDPDNEFFQYGKRLSRTSGLQGLRFFVLTLLPENILKVIGIRIIPSDIANFYNEVVIKVIKERLEKNIVRPDFIHLMLQARKNELKADKTDEFLNDAGFSTVKEHLQSSAKNQIEWSDYDIAATSASFFFGGIESTTTLVCFALYEIALNHDVQQKLRAEVDATKLSLGDAKLTYESMQQMKYMDMVITETLRKWPPFGVTNRRCTKAYSLENANGTKVTVHKGQVIFIPIYEIQRDAQYYPNPERFDPERFSDQNRGNLNQDTYLPFGIGPRNCIGSRLTLMQAKCYLFYMLTCFEIQLSTKTDVPMQLDARSSALNAKNGFWMQLIPRGV
ncbi:cytochrome P450 9e2 [Aedes aegypti]|uniref:Uncharacterized protein n=1 Tax=Aedes aegypti TaxID=7159 RepID=A0A6I8T5K0_AEDAE|nr:cytochrome P450 9e2 [Aedes aegypti]